LHGAVAAATNLAGGGKREEMQQHCQAHRLRCILFLREATPAIKSNPMTYYRCECLAEDLINRYIAPKTGWDKIKEEDFQRLADLISDKGAWAGFCMVKSISSWID
jgi:hypothetical protein